MSYKIESIKLENFAKYANVEVSFDRNITYLVGNNGSGKSTLGLNGIWFMFQGIAEKASGYNMPLIGERFRFIGPSSPTAKGEMILVDEEKGIEIKVIRKLSKSGSELKFEAPEGATLDQSWLNDLFNVFLLCPKKFTELSGREQARILGIDTSEIDLRLKQTKEDFTFLNRELRQFDGLSEPEKAERVDVSELNARKNKIVEQNRQNDEFRRYDENLKLNIQNIENSIADIDSQIKALNEKKIVLGVKKEEYASQMKSRPTVEENQSTEEIDRQINEAGTTNLKADQYAEYLRKRKAKENKEAEVKLNKAKQTEIEEERIRFIQSKKLPFKNLTIDEDGNLLFDSKPLKEPYFSTGELIKIIPILLASQNQQLKYVFIQDFNLLDEDRQNEVEKYLTDKGFQLVIEYIGKEPVQDKNCILLKDNQVVSEMEDERESINL